LGLKDGSKLAEVRVRRDGPNMVFVYRVFDGAHINNVEVTLKRELRGRERAAALAPIVRELSMSAESVDLSADAVVS